MTDMNIYKKIAVLQDEIKVNKGNRNEFADFNYRTIQDILSELKPHLKKLELMINFGSGKLDEDKYNLEMKVTDVNNPGTQIIESGEIYIDRNKSKMDLSQKVLSAKTFLKKSMLEDLLLISEDDDPDSHNNNNNNNTEQKQIKRLQNILYFALNKDKNKMADKLEELTKFKGRDNKEVNGIREFNKLKGKRLEVTLGKVEKQYPEAVKKVENIKKGECR